MTIRRPIFTVISLFIAVVFTLVSRPLLVLSIEQQLAEAYFNSADAVEDSGRMAGFALIVGQTMCVGIGATFGVVLAAIGFWRRERWKAVRWCSLLLNLAAAGFVGLSFFPLWR
jgi:hypothetical protein